MVGRVAGIYGVKGWVKVQSFTEPPAELLTYTPWLIRRAAGWQTLEPVQGKPHGKGLIIHPAGCDDRDSAGALVGTDIFVTRDRFPVLPAGEYYWADLEGLRVITRSGADLGRIERLFDTGANAVMVVRGDRERLIPFVRGDVVQEVDLVSGVMTVDWDPDF